MYLQQICADTVENGSMLHFNSILVECGKRGIAKFAMFFQTLQRGAPNLSYDASGGERCERARPGTAVSFGDLTTFLDADVRFAPWTACPLVPRVNLLHPPDLENLFLLFWFLASSEVHCAALDAILMIGSIPFAE